MTRRQGLAAVAAEHMDEPDTQQVVINLGDLRGLLAIHNGVVRERNDARAALAEAERWLRTIAANPYSECPHAGWAREAQHDVDVAHLKTGGNDRG